MLFTSYSFILFLLIVFLLYYVCPKSWQGFILLAASYVFYAANGIGLIVFLISTTLSTYLVSRKLEALHEEQKFYLLQHKSELDRQSKKEYKAGIKKRKWRWLLLCLFYNFGVLAIFKYTNFTIANMNSLLQTVGSSKTISFVNLVLPMGISFYIFQTMGYIIDVYRGTVPAEHNLGKLALFVSFFPQLVQGPISRYSSMAETLFKEHNFEKERILFGLQRILWGYYKKMVIADRILPAVNTIIQSPEEYQGAFVLVGMVFYAVELYADFTGGIDITIGIAQIFGVDLAENFERPFFSKNITEYWRRWHITMGTWFKDYLFYPFSVCKPMRDFSKWSRKHLGEHFGKRIPVYISTLVVWFITGLWHGSNWNFIVWGVLNGVVILVSQECSPLYERFHRRFKLGDRFGYDLFQIARTFLLMCSLRLFDCYKDVGTAFRMFTTLFSKWNYDELFKGSLMELGLGAGDYIILVAGVLSLWGVSMLKEKNSVRKLLNNRLSSTAVYVFMYMLFLVILIFGAYGIGYDASQFIYNQF